MIAKFDVLYVHCDWNNTTCMEYRVLGMHTIGYVPIVKQIL